MSTRVKPAPKKVYSVSELKFKVHLKKQETRALEMMLENAKAEEFERKYRDLVGHCFAIPPNYETPRRIRMSDINKKIFFKITKVVDGEVYCNMITPHYNGSYVVMVDQVLPEKALKFLRPYNHVDVKVMQDILKDKHKKELALFAKAKKVK